MGKCVAVLDKLEIVTAYQIYDIFRGVSKDKLKVFSPFFSPFNISWIFQQKVEKGSLKHSCIGIYPVSLLVRTPNCL